MTIDAELAAGHITLRPGGPTAEVVVGDGNRHNALRDTGWDALTEVFNDLSERPETRAVVIRGAADSFCAGSDLTEWIDADLEAVEDSFARMETAFRAVERCRVPVVAELSGIAAGAGCQLALACDLRVMADTARIGMPIARLGINTSPAFASRMSTLIGPSATRKLLYTGQLLEASEARSHGLADAVVPEAELAAHADSLLEEITRQPQAAIDAAKHAVATAMGQPHTPTTAARPAVDPSSFTHALASIVQQ